MIKPFQHLGDIIRDHFLKGGKEVSPVQEVVTSEITPTEPEDRVFRDEQNRRWLFSHYAQLYSKYKGKGIAVYDQKVIASDRDMEKVIRKVEERPDRKGVIVMYIDPKDRWYAFS